MPQATMIDCAINTGMRDEKVPIWTIKTIVVINTEVTDQCPHLRAHPNEVPTRIIDITRHEKTRIKGDCILKLFFFFDNIRMSDLKVN